MSRAIRNVTSLYSFASARASALPPLPLRVRLVPRGCGVDARKSLDVTNATVDDAIGSIVNSRFFHAAAITASGSGLPTAFAMPAFVVIEQHNAYGVTLRAHVRETKSDQQTSYDTHK